MGPAPARLLFGTSRRRSRRPNDPFLANTAKREKRAQRGVRARPPRGGRGGDRRRLEGDPGARSL